jgi:pantoate--beta-alanine ligase
MSSRNAYLAAAERIRAPALYRELRAIADTLAAGERDYAPLASSAKKHLKMAGWNVDYIEIRDADTLSPATSATQAFVVLGAAWLGTTRLIDNLEVTA